MDVSKIALSQADARDLYRQYKDHRHYSTPIDDEIRRTYRAISQGKVVIQALESIKAAGLNDKGLPKLAIGRADLSEIFLDANSDGSVAMMSDRQSRIWHHSEVQSSVRITFPAGSFVGVQYKRRQRAMLPLIPIHLRPRQALESYHVLWEAEWEPIPPRDPYLLRRMGKADLWLVVAAWDLTDVERAALATRVTAQ